MGEAEKIRRAYKAAIRHELLKRDLMNSYTFKNLQVLRGVAAMLVAYFHLQPMLAIPYAFDANDYTGAFGVDIFFVISGFVMYISNAEMRRPMTTFMIGRFFRIVPLYWLSTFVLVALFYAGFHPNGLNHFELSMLPRSMFFIMSVFPDGRHDLVLSLGWTLIYELFFYFVFALTFGMRTPERSLAAVSVFFLLLVSLGVMFPNTPPSLKYFLQPIILEFVSGGLLAVLVMRWRRRGGVLPAWIVPAALFAMMGAVVAMVLGLKAAGWIPPTDDRALVWGLPAMVIAGSLVVLELRGWIIGSRLLLLMGSASYALYLFHPVAMQATVKAVSHIHLPAATGVIFAVVAALSAAAIVSVVIHLTIETAVLRAGKRVVYLVGGLANRRTNRRALSHSVHPAPGFCRVDDR